MIVFFRFTYLNQLYLLSLLLLSSFLHSTGDDFGKVCVFNYPCVVDNAPRSSHGGHSSHVMNLKFSPADPSSAHSGRGGGRGHEDLKLVTVGGNDNAAMTWAVR